MNIKGGGGIWQAQQDHCTRHKAIEKECNDEKITNDIFRPTTLHIMTCNIRCAQFLYAMVQMYDLALTW